MADLKFSCPKCDQHISCDTSWAGRPLQCPACQAQLVAPHAVSIPTEAPAAPREIHKAAGPKLAPGATQVRRSNSPPRVDTRKFQPRLPSSDNALLKYGLLGLLVAGLAAVGYFYGLPRVTEALRQSSPASSGGSSSQAGTAGAGPLGEVNGAMDVSDTLDGGSSAQPHARPSTNSAPRPRAR